MQNVCPRFFLSLDRTAKIYEVKYDIIQAVTVLCGMTSKGTIADSTFTKLR